MKNGNEHFFPVFISNLCIFLVKCLSNLLPIGKLVGCKSSLCSLDSSSLPNIIFKYLNVASSAGTLGHWECVVSFWLFVFWLIFGFYHVHSENFFVLIPSSMILLEDLLRMFPFLPSINLVWHKLLLPYYFLQAVPKSSFNSLSLCSVALKRSHIWMCKGSTWTASNFHT